MAAAISAEGWPRLLRPFVSRPYLIAGLIAGVAAGFAASLWINRPVTRWLIGWDTGLLVFIGLSLASMVDVDHARMKQRAILHDEGRHAILGLALAAAVASVVAILAELGGAKNTAGGAQVLKVALTAGTIALSWFFVHVVFALHYAHVYYAADDLSDDVNRCGLDFPDDEPPDYWDFLYFAVVLGATSQTADVNIRSKEIRRVATVHGIIAFAFNTAILATMINLAAGLF